MVVNTVVGDETMSVNRKSFASMRYGRTSKKAATAPRPRYGTFQIAGTHKKEPSCVSS